MKEYDVLIIGGGPGGLTASVYASRANLSTAFIEKDAPGGKLVKTSKVQNWTGDVDIVGADLAMRMFTHSTAFGSKFIFGEVENIESKGEFDHIVSIKNGEQIKAKAVIIATGMVERVPEDVKGIHTYNHKGVHYCAICDGSFYKGEDVAVIGAGNSAIEEATYLASIARKVYIFVRSKIKADKLIIENMNKKDNIEIMIGGKILELKGDDRLGSAIIYDGKTEREIVLKAVFPYIGHDPVSAFAKNLNIPNETGFIDTDKFMETSTKGIYAIGDIRTKEIRQIATAASDGAIAGKILGNRITK